MFEFFFVLSETARASFIRVFVLICCVVFFVVSDASAAAGARELQPQLGRQGRRHAAARGLAPPHAVAVAPAAGLAGRQRQDVDGHFRPQLFRTDTISRFSLSLSFTPISFPLNIPTSDAPPISFCFFPYHVEIIFHRSPYCSNVDRLFNEYVDNFFKRFWPCRVSVKGPPRGNHFSFRPVARRWMMFSLFSRVRKGHFC